jgi:2-haloalkanoic acid dehalogenase type II
MLDRVRAITFDLDDTLWPCAEVIRAAEAAWFDWLEREAPQLTKAFDLAALRQHRLDYARRRPELAHDMTALRREALAELLRDHGHDAALAGASVDVFRAARNRVRPYAEVAGALAALRPRFTLVSVTNGNAQVEQTPLRDCFDLSLTAAEVGAARPDPAIFHAASDRTGVPLQAFVHVGDDPLRDVAAARALGLPTVWVNRDGREWPAGVARADVEADSLTRLVELLSEAAGVHIGREAG